MYSETICDVVLVDRLVSVILQNLSLENESHFLWLHSRPCLACFLEILHESLAFNLNVELLSIALTNRNLYLSCVHFLGEFFW